MNNKIFVTGGCGLIGRNLVEYLLNKGHIVSSCDNFIGSDRDNIIVHPNHTFYEVDILNLGLMKEITKESDVIYHTGCLPHECFSMVSPVNSSQSIVTGTSVIGVCCVENKVRRVVNFSSMARYGLTQTPYKEEYDPRPHDVYAISKLAAEKILNNLANLYEFEVVHLIPYNLFGPYVKYNDPFRSVVAIWTNLLLQNKRPTIYGDGQQMRSISFTQDIIPIIYNFIDCSIENGEVFNLGNGLPPLTINELFEKVRKATGQTHLEAIYMPARPNEVKNAYPNCEKIINKFSYNANLSLEEGIQSVVNYIKNKGVKPFSYHIPLEILNSEKIPETWKKRLF